MSEQKLFLKDARDKSADKTHRQTMTKATGNHYWKVEAMKTQQFKDWQESRQQAAAIKQYTIDNLATLLESFEKKISARGAKVEWASNAADARRIIADIVKDKNARQIVKSKSMTTEEIDLNDMLEGMNIETIESDLGELIVQMREEKPYHIVTPAMHLTREQIAELFHEKLGTPEDASPEALTMAAREHLRDVYVNADIGITGANFMIADEGAILMLENEGNGRLSMSCPKTHIVLVGIEKVLPRLSDLSLFLPLIATSGTGQHLTSYSSIVRGPKQSHEADGPEEMIVILLDNGRSDLLADPDCREALRCIRCGACLNVCPVYKSIGGHSYHSTYQGPIGSVITPHLRGLSEFQHLSYASSLCGACSDTCPVSINLHHMLLHNREKAYDEKANDFSWRFMMRLWAKAMSSRSRLNWARKLYGLNFLNLMPQDQKKRIPPMAKKSFAQLWKEDHES